MYIKGDYSFLNSFYNYKSRFSLMNVGDVAFVQMIVLFQITIFI